MEDNTEKTIEEMTAEISAFHNKLFNDTEGEQSIKTKIENIMSKYDVDIIDLDNKVAAIDKLYVDSIEGDEENSSLKQELEALKIDLIDGSIHKKSVLTEFNEQLELLKVENESAKIVNDKIKELHDVVFNSELDEEGVEINASLLNRILATETKLKKLIKEANDKLFALTDSSLHNAFAKRATNFTNEFKANEKLTLNLTYGVIADILFFGIVQIVLICLDKPFNYHILLYQFSIASALVFAIWMVNRNQKIAKKLAEEYHHKASLAEAMTGYRALYDLKHESVEYLELFNSLKDQLNTNPSKSIDEFLNLKSPQENIGLAFNDSVEKITDVVKPQNN
jgi:hypothetical protein